MPSSSAPAGRLPVPAELLSGWRQAGLCEAMLEADMGSYEAILSTLEAELAAVGSGA